MFEYAVHEIKVPALKQEPLLPVLNASDVQFLSFEKLKTMILNVRRGKAYDEVLFSKILATQKGDLLKRIFDYLCFYPNQPTSIGDGDKVQSEEEKLKARAEKVKTRRDLLDEIIQLELSKKDSSFKFSRKSLKTWEDLLSLEVHSPIPKSNSRWIEFKIDVLFGNLRPMAVLQNQFIDTVRDNSEQRDHETLTKFQAEYNNIAKGNRTMFQRIFGNTDDLNMKAIFKVISAQNK